MAMSNPNEYLERLADAMEIPAEEMREAIVNVHLSESYSSMTVEQYAYGYLGYLSHRMGLCQGYSCPFCLANLAASISDGSLANKVKGAAEMLREAMGND